MRAVAFLGILALAGGGCALPDRDEREAYARAGLKLAVYEIGDALVSEMTKDGEFTKEEARKVASFVERKASALVDRIWEKVEDKLDE